MTFEMPSLLLDPKYKPLLDQLESLDPKYKVGIVGSWIRGLKLGYVESIAGSAESQLDKLRSMPEVMRILDEHLFAVIGRESDWKRSERETTERKARKANQK